VAIIKYKKYIRKEPKDEKKRTSRETRSPRRRKAEMLFTLVIYLISIREYINVFELKYLNNNLILPLF
jgi:cytoskeletal protein RodZ